MATGNIKKAVPKNYFSTLAENTDFDSITESGFYYVNSGTNAPNSTKTHYNVWVQRFGSDVNYLHQLAIGINSTDVYIRIKNGTFSVWKKITST